MNPIKIQRPLYWHQGLFLQPQHFQMQERVHHSQLVPFLSYQTPHFWGVGQLEIDEGALGTGSFHLHSGSFLFQDGSYLHYPGNSLLEARSLALTDNGKPLTVYLGLRRWSHCGSNVTVVGDVSEAGRAATRFIALTDPEEVVDLHGGGPDGQVRQLHYLLKLFREDELGELGDYLLIPLARVENGNCLRISDDFIPPALSLQSSKPLARSVNGLRDLLAARSHQLEQYKRQRGIHNAEFGSRDMVYLLALMTLNRHLPRLNHLTEQGPVHPWAVYGALRELIGELSSFSLGTNALGAGEGAKLPAYDHQDLGGCFSAAHDSIIALLDEIAAGPDYVIRLVNDGSCFTAELKPSQLDDGNRYYLALRTELDPATVRQSLDAMAKLSSRERLPVLNAHALPGLRMEQLPTPPQQLPRRSNTVYLSVDHQSEQWETVTSGHNIALHWDDAPQDLEVELMIVEKMKQPG